MTGVTATSNSLAALSVPHLVRMRKRGRLVTLAKVVRVSGEPVLAQVYRDLARPVPKVVSQPESVLQHALAAGARRWLVRLDGSGDCFSIDITEALAAGWRQLSDGRLELFVPLARFRRTHWVEWEYIPADGPAVVVDEDDASARSRGEGVQLALFSLFGGEGAQ